MSKYLQRKSTSQRKPAVKAFGRNIVAFQQTFWSNCPPSLLKTKPCPVNSFTVDACFTWESNTASYNPRLSESHAEKIKSSFPKRKERFFILYTSVFTAAIGYSIEADGDRRKHGLTSRVMFLNKSRTETDFQLNGTLDLRGQNQKSCIKITAKLKVRQIYNNMQYRVVFGVASF